MKKFNLEKLVDFKEKYSLKADENGYLRLGDVGREEFGGRQVKNIASLLDGSEEINLGENLKYEGNSGNYSDMKIHIDDLDEFIKRINQYYK